jgi:K+-transporting ATPase ATPase A chain
MQIIGFALAVLVLTKPLGVYLFLVFESDQKPPPRVFGRLEQFLFRLCGVDATAE